MTETTPAKPRKLRPNSKWGKLGRRVDSSLKMDDARWVQTTKGWRYITDSVSEDDWIRRRFNPPGFRRGASIAHARVMLEPVPRNKPERVGGIEPHDYFGGPMGFRTHGGMLMVKMPRELRSWARPVTVRGKPASDTGIRKAELKSTFALVTWPDHRQDWVNAGNVREVEPEKRFGLVIR